MAEIRDYSNNPDPQTSARWPEGMAMSAVNDTGRVDEGIIGRWEKDFNGSLVSAGTASAYTLTPNRDLVTGQSTPLYDGLILAFKPHVANDASATLNVQSTGALPIQDAAGNAVSANTLIQNRSILVAYSTDANAWVVSNFRDFVTPEDRTTSRSLAKQATLRGDVFDVKDPQFAGGAIGDGDTANRAQDTAAITAAWNAAIDSSRVKAPVGSEWSDAYFVLSQLYFPPGDYFFDGPALGASINTAISVVGAGRRAVRIRLADGIYMFDIDQFIYNWQCRDFSTLGGKGLFRHSRTAENTGGYFEFDSMDFLNYTECGIGSISENVPKWNVRSCTFYGTDTSIGLVVPDRAAQGDIVHNSFDRNRYHMKVSCLNSAIQIGPNNTYLKAAGTRVADVWLVGRQTTETNSGDGLSFIGERFSNELMTAGDRRVLIAEEDTGTGADIMTRQHATTDSGGYWVSQVKFRGCNFQSVGQFGDTANKGIVTTYLSRTQVDFLDCTAIGGWSPYWLEFESGVNPAQVPQVNISRVTNPQVRREENAPQICNRQGVVSFTPYAGGYRGPQDQSCLVQGADYSYENVLNQTDPNNWALSSNGGIAPTRVSATDYYGASLAATITYADNIGVTNSGLTETNMVAGERCWMAVDLKKAATNPLDFVYVQIRESPGNTLKRFYLPVPDQWDRFFIPWNVNLSPTNIIIEISAADAFVSGSKEQMTFGRPSLYRGNTPMNDRHQQIVGDKAGLWNGPHIILNNNHLWFDSNNQLRRKASAPTSDTDGVLLG